MTPAPRDIFLDSLSRCLADETFLVRFYDRFMASSDEVAAKFVNTNFEKQRGMLARSLKLVALATSGSREGLREIRDRAETHDRRHLDVRPKLYDLWLESIVTTAAEIDPQWTADVEAAWRRLLGFVIQRMASRY